jgi:hypothetical protein
VLGQFTGQDESDGGLDLSGVDGRLLVVGSKLGSLGGDLLEDVCLGSDQHVHDASSSRMGGLTVDKGVEDGHGTVGDTSIGVNLLEDYAKRVPRSARDEPAMATGKPKKRVGS